MKQMKFYLKQLLIFILGILILSLLMSIFTYFNILNSSISKIISIIFINLLILWIGIECGKKKEKNGYLEGLKMGGLFILILLLLNVIFFGSPFKLSRLAYYVLILLFSVIGSMVGINKKR